MLDERTPARRALCPVCQESYRWTCHGACPARTAVTAGTDEKPVGPRHGANSPQSPVARTCIARPGAHPSSRSHRLAAPRIVSCPLGPTISRSSLQACQHPAGRRPVCASLDDGPAPESNRRPRGRQMAPFTPVCAQSWLATVPTVVLPSSTSERAHVVVLAAPSASNHLRRSSAAAPSPQNARTSLAIPPRGATLHSSWKGRKQPAQPYTDANTHHSGISKPKYVPHFTDCRTQTRTESFPSPQEILLS